MSIITCPDCEKQISSRAASCPGCGAPVQSAREVAATGSALATTQLTSKRIKLLRLVGLIIFSVGMAMTIVFANDENPGIFWVTTSIVGFVIVIYTSIKRWWHHS